MTNIGFWNLAKKEPTKIPKNRDKRVSSMVNFVAFNSLGKLSIIKSI